MEERKEFDESIYEEIAKEAREEIPEEDLLEEEASACPPAF